MPFPKSVWKGLCRWPRRVSRKYYLNIEKDHVSPVRNYKSGFHFLSRFLSPSKPWEKMELFSRTCVWGFFKYTPSTHSALLLSICTHAYKNLFLQSREGHPSSGPIFPFILSSIMQWEDVGEQVSSKFRPSFFPAFV